MIACIKQARDGDPRATETLVKTLRPRISKLAAYYGRACGEDPDDLLQEGWLGLLEALPEVDVRIGSPEHYLTARARWRILDTIKRARVRRCAPLEDTVDTLASSDGEDALASACASEFISVLQSNQKEVLDCLLAGFTWREAGDVLGCASSNIAYHVRKIRRQYERWIDEPTCSI